MADPPSLQIAWALLRNVRTLFGRTSSVGQKGATRPGAVNEEIAAQAAQRDIEVTSNMAVSAAEVPTLHPLPQRWTIKEQQQPTRVAGCVQHRERPFYIF